MIRRQNGELSVGFLCFGIPYTEQREQKVRTIQSRMISAIFNCHGFFKVPKIELFLPSWDQTAHKMPPASCHDYIIKVYRKIFGTIHAIHEDMYIYSYESIIKL